MDNHCIQSKTTQKDLGIIVSSDLNWSAQVTSIVKRANTLGYILFKAFSRPNKQIFSGVRKHNMVPLAYS